MAPLQGRSHGCEAGPKSLILRVSTRRSDGAYLLGSLLFVGGSLCGLWMWKAEQYGLGLLPEINPEELSERPAEYGVQHELLAQYGCGRSSMLKVPSLERQSSPNQP